MEHTLKSGNKLVLNVASFEKANALRKSITRFIETHQGVNISNAFIYSDDDVEKNLFECCAFGVYNGAKINPSLFDDIKLGSEARKDMIEIFDKVVEVNVKPFFQQASSESPIR